VKLFTMLCLGFITPEIYISEMQHQDLSWLPFSVFIGIGEK